MLWYLNLYENDGTRSAMWGRAFLQIIIIQKKKKKSCSKLGMRNIVGVCPPLLRLGKY